MVWIKVFVDSVFNAVVSFRDVVSGFLVVVTGFLVVVTVFLVVVTGFLVVVSGFLVVVPGTWVVVVVNIEALFELSVIPYVEVDIKSFPQFV